MKLSRFQELDCWQEARTLVKEIYTTTKNGLLQEGSHPSGQIQAAGVSIMADINKGFISHSDKEFIQFLFIATSSATEVQSHPYIYIGWTSVTLTRRSLMRSMSTRIGLQR